MLTVKNIDTKMIPQKGWFYAIFQRKLYFVGYSLMDGQIILDNDDVLPDENEMLLECHCFDPSFEYRLIASESIGNTDGIEAIISKDSEKEMSNAQIKKEELLIEDKYLSVGKKLSVMNYFDFDENDSLQLVNYRLVDVLA